MQAGSLGIVVDCFDSLRADRAALEQFLNICTAQFKGHGLIIYSRALTSAVPDWLRSQWPQSVVVDHTRLSELRLLRLCGNVYVYNKGACTPYQKIKLSQHTTPVSPACIGYIASNGTGLGHVMRLQAVAAGLGPYVHSSCFMSYSAGLMDTALAGSPVFHLASAEYLMLDPLDSWGYIREATRQFIAAYNPTHLVYDGNIVPTGLWAALAAYPDIHFTWIRRGMWRIGAAPHSMAMQALADVVLEPGDIAALYDKGPTTQAIDIFAPPRQYVHTPPIRANLWQRPYSRTEACAALGLDASARYALIMLGAVKPDDAVALNQLHAVIAAVKAQGNIVPVVAHWPIAHSERPVIEGAYVIEQQPLAPFYAAFDIVVSAAGYNSFHELMATDRPVIFIPNIEASRDMQEVRARYAADYMLAAYVHPDALQSLESIISQGLAHGPKKRHTINWLTDWSHVALALGLVTVDKHLQHTLNADNQNTQQNTALWMPRLWTIFRKKRQWMRKGNFTFVFAFDIPAKDCLQRLLSVAYDPYLTLVITNSVHPIELRRAGYRYVWANMEPLKTERQRDRWMLHLCKLWRPNKMKVF